MIIDADEFYPHLENNLNQIASAFHKGADYAVTMHNYEFYFDFNHCIKPGPIYTAVKKSSGCRFTSSRSTNAENRFEASSLCYHYGYVKTYERLEMKMRAFGDIGKWWMKNIASNFGKVPDEELGNKNSYAHGSIHLLQKGHKFLDARITHPDILKPLIKEWKWTSPKSED